MQKLAQQLYQENKSSFDLLSNKRPVSGFETAVSSLFGQEAQPKKTVKLGGTEYNYSSRTGDRVRFLPAQWVEALEGNPASWQGCENWWAGFPLIAWVEINVVDGIRAQLKLNAELGPISDYQARTKLVQTLGLASSQRNLERIQFPKSAMDKSSLYSQFFRRNTVPVRDFRDASEIERQFLKLIADFRREFEMIASAIRETTHS